MRPPLRILIADDHPIVRDGIRLVLERAEVGSVVAEAENGRDAVELCARHRPDLAILDIGMTGLNGMDATARVKEVSPATRVLILSGHSASDFVIRSLRAGADGYFVKDTLGAELVGAVRTVMAGGKYLSPRISKDVVDDLLEGRGAAGEGSSPLSDRQREILQLIAEGKSTKEIAFSLNLSAKTVETHRARIMERLGIDHVPGLVVYAIRHGLIDVERDPRDS